MPTPKKGEIFSIFFASDWHSEFMDEPSYSILKQVVKKSKKADKRVLVIGGDFLDAPHLMGKKPDLKRMAKCTETIEQYLIPKTEEEFDWGNRILDECEKIFDCIYFVGGNHCEYRYSNWVKNYCPSAYRHNFDLHLQLDLKARGIPLIKYNDYLDCGDLTFTHGMWHSTTHNQKHFYGCGKSIIYGHLHHADSKSFYHRGNAKKAWSAPAMCGLNPDYCRNTDRNWSNGFIQVLMRHDYFNVYVHEIFNGVLTLPSGELISGK